VYPAARTKNRKKKQKERWKHIARPRQCQAHQYENVHKNNEVRGVVKTLTRSHHAKKKEPTMGGKPLERGVEKPAIIFQKCETQTPPPQKRFIKGSGQKPRSSKEEKQKNDGRRGERRVFGPDDRLYRDLRGGWVSEGEEGKRLEGGEKKRC